MNRKLLQQHQQYMAKQRAAGARILSYRTPCCDAPLETTVPDDSQTWDSLCSCPHCDQLYMKVCSRDQVKVFLPPHTAPAARVAEARA